MVQSSLRRRLLGSALAFSFVGAIAISFTITEANGNSKAANAVPAVAVSIATVEARNDTIWDEFSGRLEAVGRVDVRSRVAGAIQTVHFREGALVKEGDLLVTIDPAPYAAAVDAAVARVAAAQSRLALTRREQDRSQQLLALNNGTISQSTADQRSNSYQEAEATLHAAQADLQAAKLNLGYTAIRAPISGRIGKSEITAGNLIAAGPNSPVLTTLVSVNPIYATFDADEGIVTHTLSALGNGADITQNLDRIPVEMTTNTAGAAPVQGHLQLIDNQVNGQSGTVRLRATFNNDNGALIPGQFARVRMAEIRNDPIIAINEQAIGTDQDKRFVIVVGADNKAIYREVQLGPVVGDRRAITNGLHPGERIVVSGLQQVRPGSVLNITNGTGATQDELAGR